MFHTFVGYLHGRLNVQNEEEKKKSSKVINKMQGLVSMMIMKKKQDVIQVNGKEKVNISFQSVWAIFILLWGPGRYHMSSHKQLFYFLPSTFISPPISYSQQSYLLLYVIN